MLARYCYECHSAATKDPKGTSSYTLGAYGVPVHTTTLDEAVEIARRELPDVIVLDGISSAALVARRAS